MPSDKSPVSFVANQVSAVVVKSAVANFVPIEAVTVVAKLGSSPKAAASSLRVSSVVGALSTKFATAIAARASARASVKNKLVVPSVKSSLLVVPACCHAVPSQMYKIFVSVANA